jgi:hypothetical protein
VKQGLRVEARLNAENGSIRPAKPDAGTSNDYTRAGLQDDYAGPNCIRGGNLSLKIPHLLRPPPRG